MSFHLVVSCVDLQLFFFRYCICLNSTNVISYVSSRGYFRANLIKDLSCQSGYIQKIKFICEVVECEGIVIDQYVEDEVCEVYVKNQLCEKGTTTSAHVGCFFIAVHIHIFHSNFHVSYSEIVSLIKSFISFPKVPHLSLQVHRQ